jgi:ABC-type multidrug transport system fused ATPase/permease subunit
VPLSLIKSSFAYLPGKNVLHHIDFSLKPGETLAIVGAQESAVNHH